MPYILNTLDDQKQMLDRIGVPSIDELLNRQVPEELRLGRPLNVPAALTEMELTAHLHALADQNQSAADSVCFLGGGAYDHFIPAVVDTIASRSEYYTAYTPYQAEASQGLLQAFYEYQTLMCQLTGMEVSNASLYEGGSSVAEAALMALNLTDRDSGQILIAESVHPHYRECLTTLLANWPVQVVTVPTPEGFLDPDILKTHLTETTACVIAQHPNFFGCLEEVEAITELAHKHGALSVVSFDPISLGLLKRPGDYDADIAVAEGQCFGVPLGYGGPYLGILACRQEYIRKIPGRLVGETTDRHGNRCWVLTLQTREQHIRREKATSNICTNQGLLALRATVHLASLGPQGLRETAELCLRKAHYAAEKWTQTEGISLRFDRPFFKEFTLQLSEAGTLSRRLAEQGFLGGLHLGKWYPNLDDCASFALTEKRTRAEIDSLATTVSQLLTGSREHASTPV